MEIGPFIGIMGIQTLEEGRRLAQFGSVFSKHRYRLLLGTYADWWTLHGAADRAFLPSCDVLSSMSCQENGVAHAVHFTPSWQRDLAEQLGGLMAVCPNLSVLILHAVWPKRDVLVQFRRQWPAVSLVLWVSEECFLDLADKTTRVAHRIGEYSKIGVVDSVILDLAAGRGARIDDARAVFVLQLLRQAGVELPCGVAGGLSYELFDAGLQKLMHTFDPLSLAASHHLRTGNQIDPIRVNQFLRRALVATEPLSVQT